MNRTLFLVPASLVLVAGCTFQRRPPPESSGSAATGTGTSRAAAGMSSADGGGVAGARAFLRDFQAERRSDAISRVRASLARDAVLLRGSRPLPGGITGPDAEALLRPPDGKAAAAAMLESVTPAGSGVVFVLRYPQSGAARGASFETLVVAPDSSAPGGWTVRFLQRALETER